MPYMTEELILCTLKNQIMLSISCITDNAKVPNAAVPSTASRKFHGSLGTSRRSFVGPMKRAMGSAIVVGNKSLDTLAQLRDGDPTGASEQAANQDREPDLNLVQPGTVPGRVDQANAID